MNPKMLLFDLDGTLLTSKRVVSPATVTAIKSCKCNGYRIGFITARARSKKNIRLLDGLPCDFIAFYNGAEIYVENRLRESNAIPYKQAASMLRRINEDFPGIEISVYQEPWSYSTVSGEVWHMELGEKRKCNLSELPDCDVQRIRLESDLLDSVPLQGYMISESTFFRSVFGDAIIVHKNANKGYAVKKAAASFGISLDKIIAFGDDINDIDMLKIVGIGVAMGNAVSEVKKIAHYVTETNDCDGVAVWINEYLISNIEGNASCSKN